MLVRVVGGYGFLVRIYFDGNGELLKVWEWGVCG